jgi:serine/threonine-protein kinase
MKTLEPTPRPTVGAGVPEALESVLEDLWDRGQRPDVRDFLRARGGREPSIDGLLDVLRVDQRRRWLVGERVDVRSYLRDFPAIGCGSEAFFELLYHEILIREGLGERPDLDEYAQSFPDLAERLRLQVEVHEALSVDDLGRARATWSDGADALGDHGALPAVPGYEVLSEIGRGGMGIVYRAHQLRPSRVVALKMILEGRFATEHDVLRFENEVEAIASLDHPNVVPILEVGQHERLHYFTMPLLTGGSLAQAQERLSADPRAIAKVMIEIAGAIHHAHQRGILHRDLKPANILLDDSGRPHVTDFGLAKRAQKGTGLTQRGAVLGSPGYMAPEQASGDPAAVTTATDVYGLGGILYALLTGRAPFEGRSFHETLARVQTEPPERPSRINRIVPSQLELICLKCLEKEPGRRYPGAAAVAEDLRRWLAGEPIQARPVPPAVRAWLWVRRHPTQAALAAALALTIVVGAGVTTSLWLRALASLNAERHTRTLLQFANEGLNRTNRELERAKSQEKNARVRAQERFLLALRAVQDTIEDPGDRSILRLADSATSRQEVLRRIMELYKKLNASLEGDPGPDARAQLAWSYQRLSSLSAQVGAGDTARAALGEALAIRHELSAREPDNRQRLLEEAAAFLLLGGVERQFALPEVAIRPYEEARALLDTLAHRNPADDFVQNQLTWCLGNIGVLQSYSGRLGEALDTHSRVIEIRDGLIRRNPGNMFYRADRAWARHDVAYCLGALGKVSEAVDTLERARQEYDAARRELPGNAELAYRLTVCLGQLAELRRQQNEFAATLAVSERACALAEELARTHPETSRFKELLGTRLWRHSAHQRVAKLPSRGTLARAAAIYEDLVKSYPGVDQFRASLVEVSFREALWARADRDHAAAKAAARRAVDRSIELMKDPTAKEALAKAANCYLMLAIIELDEDRPEEAKPSISAAESIMRRFTIAHPIVEYDLACALSLLSVHGRTTAERAAINDRAMDTLLLAVKHGFSNWGEVRNDPDFAPLRHRREYRLLLLDMEFPQDPFRP